MTALHHYWLHKATAAPAPPAVFAWPCFPTKLYTQGAGAVLNTGFPNMLLGKLPSDPWDGGPSDASPCELVMFRNSGEQNAQSTALGYFNRGDAWCVESRVGCAQEDAGFLAIFPLRWSTGGVWVRHTPSSGEITLFVAGAPVQTVSSAALSSGVLHHWALTYAGGTLRVWLNGGLLMTQSATVAPASGAGLILRYEGASYYAGELYVGGVRYWDREHYTAPFVPPTQLTIS